MQSKQHLKYNEKHIQVTYLSEKDGFKGDAMFLSDCTPDDDASKPSSSFADPPLSLESLKINTIYYSFSNYIQYY